MNAVTVELSPHTERTLREKATLLGLSLEGYLQQLADHDAGDATVSSCPPPDEKTVRATMADYEAGRFR
ncbi:MAG: hypothetical protein ACJ8F7_10665 [Gemmataceae bacterium]